MLLLCALIAGSGSAWAQSWVKTDITDLSNGDIVVVLETAKYNKALLNAEATSSGSVKASDVVTLSTDGTEISSDVATNIQWVFGGTSTSFTLKSNDTGERQLWCRDNNDALRVKATSPGTAYVGTFTWDSDYKMMKSTSLTRYVGVWKNSDTDYQWRAYSSQTATNIKGTETSFYKYTDSSSSLTSTTTSIDATGITNTDLHKGAVAGQLTATVKAGETTLTGVAIVWSSSKTDVATVDGNGNVRLVAVGTTVITAAYNGDGETYKGSSATYELTVEDNDPNILTATFEFGANKYEWESTSNGQTYYDGSDYNAKEGNITIGFSGKVRLWVSSGSYTMRFYSDDTYGRGTMTLTADDGYAIIGVSITGSTLSFQNPSSGTIDEGEWTGVAKTLSIEKGSSTSNFTTVVVTYKPAISLASACTDGTKFYGTYSNSSAFVVPSDLTVSEISVIDGELLVDDYETGDIVPANTGVMVSSETAGDHTIALSDETGSSVLGSDNMLKPSSEAMTGNCKFYRLTMHNGETIGFWWGAEDGAAFDIGANKAYLAVPQSLARSGFSLFGDETNGIAEVGKAIRAAEDKVYDLQGRRLGFSVQKKGLYIVNGKKVMY